MKVKEQDYYTPSGLYLWGIDDKGNITIKKSSYNRALTRIYRQHPDKSPEIILENFFDYWQSHIVKIKESKFRSPTSIWKYKKIWREVGLMI